jgi:hypothetical protein
MAGKKDDKIMEFAEEILDDPQYRQSLKMRIMNGRANHIETMLFHYRYGKPAERLELDAGGTLAEIIAYSREKKLKDATPAIEEGEVV